MATAERTSRRLALLAVPVLVAFAIGVWTWSGREPVPEPITVPITTEPMVAVSAASVYAFDSIEEMAEESDLVVVGEVVATERGRLVGDPAAGGVVSRLVTLRVDEVVRDPSGVEPTTVLVEEEGWLPDGSAVTVNGVAPSAVGDTGVWFLDDVGGPDVPTYLVINSQGRFIEEGDDLRGGDQRDPLVQAGQQESLADLVDHARGVAN